MRLTVNIIVAVGLSLLCACREEDPILLKMDTEIGQQSGRLVPIDSVYKAGQNIELSIESTGQEVCLYIISSLFEELICTQVTDQLFTMSLPEKITQNAGMLHISLLVDGTPMQEHHIIVKARMPANPLTALTGPKTISVDDAQPAQLIVIATDKYQNLCEDDTPVEITSQHPLNQRSVSNVSTQEGIVSQYFNNNQQAGILQIGARSGKVAARKKEVQYTPGIPEKITLIQPRNPLFSGIQQFSELSTDIIFDRYGNPISDGTYVEFVLSGEEGKKAIYPSSTVNGRSKISLPHPESSGKYTLSVRIPGIIESNPVSLNFEASLLNFPVEYHADKRILIIGPVINQTGGLVADGTKARVSWAMDQKEQSITVGLNNGMAHLSEDKIPGFYDARTGTVEIASIQKTIKW